MKPFTVLSMPQRSPEWLAAKCGIFSASMAHHAFWRTQKGEFRAERKNLKMRLVVEKTTGKPQEEKPKSRAMMDGEIREARSIRAYENIHGVLVRSVGFVLDNEAPIGCSPDGVIGDFEGLVQAKNPLQETHFQTLQAVREGKSALESVGLEYFTQIRHELYVTGAGWCDFFSHHHDFPERLRSVTIRVTREDANLSEYAKDVEVFMSEVEAECEKIAGWMAA